MDAVQHRRPNLFRRAVLPFGATPCLSVKNRCISAPVRYLFQMRQIWAFILLSAVAAGSGRAADVARIGTNTYPSLDAAVAAAQSNDTVELLGNAILTNTISIAVPLSIVSDGSVRTISRTNAVEGMDLIWVHSPGSLTLGQASGNDATPDLILDGGAVGSVTGGYSFIFAESANVTVQPGVVLQHYTGLYAPL